MRDRSWLLLLVIYERDLSCWKLRMQHNVIVTDVSGRLLGRYQTLIAPGRGDNLSDPSGT